MILTYFLPMAVMIGIYSAIGLELWGQKVIGEATTHQQENINSKRRVICKDTNRKISRTEFIYICGSKNGSSSSAVNTGEV